MLAPSTVAAIRKGRRSHEWNSGIDGEAVGIREGEGSMLGRGVGG